MENVNGIDTYCLPQNIRALRKRMNWSQEELAERIGLNRGNIASYENGTAEPRICNVVKMAHLFNVSVFDLIHTNLQEENAYQTATARHNNGKTLPTAHLLQSYYHELEDFETALKGIQCMHRLRLKNNSEIPEEYQFLQEHFDQLHSLASHILDSHKALLAQIKSLCPQEASMNANGLG